MSTTKASTLQRRYCILVIFLVLAYLQAVCWVCPSLAYDSTRENRIPGNVSIKLHRDFMTDGFWYFFAKQQGMHTFAMNKNFTELYVKYNSWDNLDNKYIISLTSDKFISFEKYMKSHVSLLNNFDQTRAKNCQTEISLPTEVKGSEISKFHQGRQLIHIKREDGSINNYFIISKMKKPHTWYNHSCSMETFYSPISAWVDLIGPLPDCSYYIEFEGSAVRIDANGNMLDRIQFPDNVRMLSLQEYIELEKEFISKVPLPHNECEDADAFLHFLESKLFGK